MNWLLIAQAVPTSGVNAPDSMWTRMVPIASTFGTLSAILTVVAVGVGGWLALGRYKRELRLRAAELLLKMEEEYRVVVATCLDFEFRPRYESRLLPVLNREAAGALSNDDDFKVLADLDRCLRFFFLCTVLNADLKVEETALARAYYYYVSLLEDGMRTPELHAYIKKYYKRLYVWMRRHRRCIANFRETGDWNHKLVEKIA